MTKNTVILYHANCLDGFGAAFASWLVFKEDAEYIPVKYNEPFPIDPEGKDIYIVDFSYPKITLEEVQKRAKFLQVIDHHKTAKENLEGLDFCLFDMEKSGAVLTFEYFFPNSPIPTLFLLIQDRDLWQWKFDATRAVTKALYELIPFDFNDWNNLLDKYTLESLEVKGYTLINQENTQIEKLLKNKHKCNIHYNIEGFAVNSPIFQSELGNALAKESGTYGCVYFYNGETHKWHFSLRSVGNFDVSELAKNFNGGGYKNAAGFILDELII